MHLVVDDVTGRSEVHGVNDLVVTIFLVAVEILGLATVPCIRNRRCREYN